MGAAMTRVETWVDGQLVGVSDQPDAVPESITSVQMRLALLDAGLLDAISAYVEHQPEDVRTGGSTPQRSAEIIRRSMLGPRHSA